MTTLLLSRAKSSHDLIFLLCASLALPPNLPTLERDDARPEQAAVALAGGHSGPSLHRPDRKAPRHLAGWSVEADEPESPGGRDDFRFTPPALPPRPLDLPSLVPALLALRPPGPGEPPVPSTYYTPPLRC